jgi:SAM-dependent methyltransferase
VNGTGPTIGDPFGQMLLDCLVEGGSDGSTVEVIERDDGFIGAGKAARYFAGPALWPAVETALLERSDGRVLDIGCGAGRHAVELQSRGMDVTGLDTSPGAIEVARRRGLSQVFPGTIYDLARTSPSPFDTLLMLGNNLGLLGDTTEARSVLTVLASIAARGALLLGTTVDPYRSIDPGHLAYHDRNRALGRKGGLVRMRVRYRNLASEWFDYALWAELEIREVAADSPWTVEDVLHEDERLGIVLRRR